MRMLKATQTRKQPRLVTPCLFSTCPIPAIPQALAARGGIRTMPSNVQASLATRPVGRHGVCVAGLLPELGPILPPFSVSSGGTPCNRRKGYPESGEAPLSIWIELWLEPPDCLISAGRPPGAGGTGFQIVTSCVNCLDQRITGYRGRPLSGFGPVAPRALARASRGRCRAESRWSLRRRQT